MLKTTAKNSIEAFVFEQLRELGYDDAKLSPSTTFGQLGVDSLALMEILVAVEKQLGMKVSLAELDSRALSCIDGFVSFIANFQTGRSATP